MKRTLPTAFLVIGLAFLAYGYHAFNSPTSLISRTMTGAPSDQAIWLTIGGLLACITGLFGLNKDEQERH